MNRIKLHDKVFETVIQYEQIESVIDRMADEMKNDIKDKEPLFISILNGSFMFTSELLKRFNFNCHVSFVKFSSYLGSESSGQIHELIGLNEPLENKTVIILEDIVDTGVTLDYMAKIINKQNPACFKTASLLFKPEVCKINIKPDYIGFEVKDVFLVGFGLDYNGLGRNFKDIYQLMP